MPELLDAKYLKLRLFMLRDNKFVLCWTQWCNIRASSFESSEEVEYFPKVFLILPFLPSFNTQSLTENSPTSAGIESEYDTASTNSRSDNEQDEYEDDEEDSLDDEATGELRKFVDRPQNSENPPTRF